MSQISWKQQLEWRSAFKYQKSQTHRIVSATFNLDIALTANIADVVSFNSGFDALLSHC